MRNQDGAVEHVSPARQPRALVLCGNLRSESASCATLAASATFAEPQLESVIFDELRGIPPFDLDEELEPPQIVLRLRALVGSSDWLIIASPEYAHGIAGTLKNLLEWLVGSESFTAPTLTAVVIEDALAEVRLSGRSITTEAIAADAGLRPQIMFWLEAISSGGPIREVLGD